MVAFSFEYFYCALVSRSTFWYTHWDWYTIISLVLFAVFAI